MAEKYRGMLPPNSVWYSLPTERASLIILYTVAKGEIDPGFVFTNVFNHETDLNTELLAPEGEINKFEQILKKYGEEIKTLY